MDRLNCRYDLGQRFSYDEHKLILMRISAERKGKLIISMPFHRLFNKNTREIKWHKCNTSKVISYGEGRKSRPYGRSE